MPELSPAELAALVEFGEAGARADYYRCAPPGFARENRVAAVQVGPLWALMVPGVDTPFFNRLSGLGVRLPASEALLDQALELFEQAGCRNIMAPLSPLAQPAALPGWLEARGFQKAENWVKVYRGAGPAPDLPTALRIEAAGPGAAADFGAVARAAFAMQPGLEAFLAGPLCRPGWRHYLAYDGAQPVAVAALYVSGDTGWLGFGGTLPSHRRCGAQSALLARRLHDGLALGCRWFVSETAETNHPSLHNLLRAGFQAAYLRPNYVRRKFLP